MKESRVAAVLENLGKMGLSQVLLTDPISIFYLTGRLIQPLERFYGLYLSQTGKHKIFINHLETVPEDLGVEKVRFGDTDPYLDLVQQAVDPKEPLGVDKNLPARFLLPLMEREAAAGYCNASLAVDQARSIKDPEEQELMRQASRINDQAILAFRDLLREGITEREVAEATKAIYLDLGADGFSFSPIVAFGANAASGHHVPDDTPLRPGDGVLFDVGCTYQGYCSDMTRTYFYKNVTPHQRQVYDLVLQANLAAEALVRPGVALKDLDGTARQIIAQGGYGPCFTHRLGHFIGLETHDFGDVSAATEETAVPGNIFSIEPGIYLSNDLGVRIEDLVLVTEEGCEVLNHVSKDLEIIP